VKAHDSQHRRHALPAITALLIALGCDGGASRPRGPVPPDAGHGDTGADAGTVQDGRPSGANETAGPLVDAAPPPEPVTEELPRPAADPKLTRRLVAGAAVLVGGDGASCSHQPQAAGDRWCAFSRKLTEQQTELWVINLSQAVLPTAPPITCDGSSPHCLRLTEQLFTGQSIWGPSYPMAHRFEDDTLVFHTGAALANAPYHEGPIWAWRPGWPAPRKLTSDKGVLCFSQPHTLALVCVDNAVVDKDPTSPFDRPRLREMDLLAGTADTVTAAAPLAKVAHLQNQGGDAASLLRLSPDGAYLAFSRVPQPGAPEVVEVVKLADAGKTAPVSVVSDAANWAIANDGSKLYYLAGFDRSKGDRATGTLMLADFPGGGNATELAKGVFFYELLGSHDEVISPVDRGVALVHGTEAKRNAALMRDRSKPGEMVEFSSSWEVAQIATDVRHSLYFRQPTGAEFPVAYVAKNDGSGFCQLTSDIHAETYGAHFTGSGRSIFWIEYGRGGSMSEEGWYARPETCGDRVKFGDFVFSYRLVDEDFVVFEGGDLQDSTSWLEYTPLGPSPGGAPVYPAVIKERPNPMVDVLRAGPPPAEGARRDAYVVFSTSQGGAAEEGLYVHGPLRAAGQ
jgi:hypothetical protein